MAIQPNPIVLRPPFRSNNLLYRSAKNAHGSMFAGK
jgi:hypothetical protein